VNSAI
jgi:hypothetical protein